MPEKWETRWIDYYKVLQVHLAAEPEVIKAAYERLARKYHPDINGSPETLDRMIELNEAYEVLGSLEKRTRYHTEYLKKRSAETGIPLYRFFSPRIQISPPFALFKDALPGEPYRQTFVIRNTGGPFSRLEIHHSNPWLRIIRQSPSPAPDRFPLEMEIEVWGQDWDKKYIDNIIVKLDETEAHIHIELQTARHSPDLRRMKGPRDPGPLCPCVLLLETSKTLNDALLKELGLGITRLRDRLSGDPVARERVELAVVTFDSSVLILQGLVTADDFRPLNLTTGRDSLMGTGISQALDIVEYRSLQYLSRGSEYFRPQVFMIAAGSPRGEPAEKIGEAAKRIREAESENQAAFFPVATGGADVELLQKISVRSPVRLIELNCSKMFNWLYCNLSGACRSDPGEKTPLQPVDWGIF